MTNERPVRGTRMGSPASTNAAIDKSAGDRRGATLVRAELRREFLGESTPAEMHHPGISIVGFQPGDKVPPDRTERNRQPSRRGIGSPNSLGLRLLKLRRPGADPVSTDSSDTFPSPLPLSF